MNKLTFFDVKGERCSGTTYLIKLIEYNLGISCTYNGWKHGYLNLQAIDNYKIEKRIDCLTIFIFRNVYDWLKSFYLTPHHLEGAKAATWVNKPTFSEFIRREIKTIHDDGSEKYCDAHPFSLEKPKNILELRKWKIENYLNYQKLKIPGYYLKYEDLIHNPEKILREINDMHFGIEFSFKEWTVYKDETGKSYTPKKYFDISDDDYKFILDNTDWNLEKIIGYPAGVCVSSTQN